MHDLPKKIYLYICLYKMAIRGWDEPQSVKETLEYLIAITEQKEKEIEHEHGKKYKTDDVENEFKNFVVLCMQRILVHYEEIDQECSVQLMALLKHRHWGYGFFTAYELMRNGDSVEQIETVTKTFFKIKAEQIDYKIIYLSFIHYCREFYGRFSDNEYSIVMICRYFSSEMGFNEEEKDYIIEALYMHISNAGTPADLGYAFNGIAAIEKNIDKLPEDMIIKLLKSYHFFSLMHNQVSYHQIYAIISNSCIAENKKEKYKFFFLDSVLLLEIMEHLLFRERERKDQKWNIVGWQNNGIGEEDFCFVKDEENEEYHLISNLERADRRLVGEQNKIVFEIELTDKTRIHYNGKVVDELFDQNDWMLKRFAQKAFIDNLEKLFLDDSEEGLRKGISFLYVYLNNYRGLNKQGFTFDNRYEYDSREKSLSFREQDKNMLAGLYGPNINSLFGIVGKNGVGKTSFVDFLCETFLLIIELLDKTEKTLADIFEEAGIGEDTEVLVLFEYDGQPYVITNIELSHCDERIRKYVYRRGLLTHHKALSKVFYFSGKIETGKVLEEKEKDQDQDVVSHINHKKEYSEMADLQYKFRYQASHERNQNDNVAVNPSLCYQLFFLRAHANNKLKVFLWEGIQKESLLLNKAQFQDVFQKFISNQETTMTADEEELLRQLMCDGMVMIQHFSSGQYAKFNFLSKLFWILQGYKEYEKLDLVKKPDNVFSYDDIIDTGDSAVLFIDEGDVYYHPEWQREYVSTLTQLINESSSDCMVQIVIATNSPFVLSDMLHENITYIPHKNEEEMTFGQNIHVLLKQNFFMRYTIGEFARKKITYMMKTLSEYDGNIEKMTHNIKEEFAMELGENEIYSFVQSFIDEIGETVYRHKLQEIRDHAFMKKEQVELERLKRERELIEQRIRKLEEGMRSHDTNA